MAVRGNVHPMTDHDQPIAGTPTGPYTLIEALDRLKGMGYGDGLTVNEDGSVHCGACHHDMPASGLDLDHLYRLEGASDPADMAAVLGLSCADCGVKGSVVVRYGPEASAADAALLRAVEDHRKR